MRMFGVQTVVRCGCAQAVVFAGFRFPVSGFAGFLLVLLVLFVFGGFYGFVFG